MTKVWLLLAAAVASEVSASLALQAATARPAWYVLVVAGYVAAFSLLAAVLRRGMTLGVAYGVWGACGVALTAVLGAWLFGEVITVTSGAGIALIIAGVPLIELGER